MSVLSRESDDCYMVSTCQKQKSKSKRKLSASLRLFPDINSSQDSLRQSSPHMSSSPIKKKASPKGQINATVVDGHPMLKETESSLMKLTQLVAKLDGCGGKNDVSSQSSFVDLTIASKSTRLLTDPRSTEDSVIRLQQEYLNTHIEAKHAKIKETREERSPAQRVTSTDSKDSKTGAYQMTERRGSKYQRKYAVQHNMPVKLMQVLVPNRSVEVLPVYVSTFFMRE